MKNKINIFNKSCACIGFLIALIATTAKYAWGLNVGFAIFYGVLLFSLPLITYFTAQDIIVGKASYKRVFSGVALLLLAPIILLSSKLGFEGWLIPIGIVAGLTGFSMAAFESKALNHILDGVPLVKTRSSYGQEKHHKYGVTTSIHNMFD